MVEEAYLALKTYLKSVAEHLADSEGAIEFIEDVEQRLAELLSDSLRVGREVVVEAYVQQAFLVLGAPEAFAGEESDEDGAAKAPGPKRLYRDAEEAMVGGVAAGIAAFFKTDPVWVRVRIMGRYFSPICSLFRGKIHTEASTFVSHFFYRKATRFIFTKASSTSSTM